MNNLTTLSDDLHQIFKDVKDNKVDPKTAKNLTDIAANIIHIAKVQIDAVRIYDKLGKMPASIMETSTLQIAPPQSIPHQGTIEEPAKYETTQIPKPSPVLLHSMAKSNKPLSVLQDEYAKSIGCDSRLQAIAKFKAVPFKNMFEAHKNNAHSNSKNS
jgi:hypothetical protein